MNYDGNIVYVIANLLAYLKNATSLISLHG